MVSTVSGLDGAPLSDHLHRVGLGSHAKLERQGSKGSKGCPTPSHKVHTPLGNRVDTDKQSEDLHGLLSIVGAFTWIKKCNHLKTQHSQLAEGFAKDTNGYFGFVLKLCPVSSSWLGFNNSRRKTLQSTSRPLLVKSSGSTRLFKANFRNRALWRTSICLFMCQFFGPQNRICLTLTVKCVVQNFCYKRYSRIINSVIF